MRIERKDEIVIKGRYFSGSRESRFRIDTLNVNGKEKIIEKENELPFNTRLTKTDFMRLISQIWPKLTTGKETILKIEIIRAKEQ